MEIKQISYFMTIAEAGSYSKAAEQIGVSQPALSIAVKKLEEELGVKLFYSFNREQRLTDEGRRFHEDSKRLLEMYQKTLDNVQPSEKSLTGSFTLGMSPLFGTCYFGDIIPAFSREFPNIEINIVEDGARKIEERIENGDVDLAVTLQAEQSKTFASTHFTTQRNVVLLNREHPLAYRTSLTVADLRDDLFAIFNRSFVLHRQIMDAAHAAGFRPKLALLSSQWDFIVELVSRNHAVSILPKPIMDRYPDPNVVCIPLTDSVKYWDIVLAWNHEKYMPRSCQVFLDYVKRNLPPDEL